MAIIQLPSDLTLQRDMICAICRVRLLLSKATAGLFDADHRQAFACVSHFSEVELLIVGWADFRAKERKKYLDSKREAETLYGVDSDVWLNP